MVRVCSGQHVCVSIESISVTSGWVIAFFAVTFTHFHYNVFERGCEAISGNFALFARNCLTSTFKYIVMQMRKVNCEKGYWLCPGCHGYLSALAERLAATPPPPPFSRSFNVHRCASVYSRVSAPRKQKKIAETTYSSIKPLTL